MFARAFFRLASTDGRCSRRGVQLRLELLSLARESGQRLGDPCQLRAGVFQPVRGEDESFVLRAKPFDLDCTRPWRAEFWLKEVRRSRPSFVSSWYLS